MNTGGISYADPASGHTYVPENRFRRDENRCAVLWVHEYDVLDIVMASTPGKDPSCTVLIRWPNLPADVRIHSVRHEWMSRRFGFVLESAEFDPVPDEDVLPDLCPEFGGFRREIVQIVRPSTET